MQRASKYFVVARLVILAHLLFSLSTSSLLSAQTNDGRKSEFRGTVVDKSGEPLTGVTIRLKGFNGGYISDMNGDFVIISDKKELDLVLSYIGYQTLERRVKNGTRAKITLYEDETSTIGEIVVTGYGTKDKKSFTGAETTIQGDKLMMQGTKNVIESLAALVPGMMIMENNSVGSDPNQTAQINIRGRSSFSTSANTPVFVVDGAQVTESYIYDMDMNDIESVTVLKDASASALYGAKASAGVIVIKTKALKGGRLKLNYSGTYRLSTPDLSDYNLLNPAQKLEYERLAGLYTAENPAEQYTADALYAQIYNQVQRGVNTDWIHIPLRNAFTHQHSLSIDGGDDRARYNLGVRYNKNEGVMKGSDRERLSVNYKLSYSVQDKFYVSNTSTLSNITSKNSPYGSFSNWVSQNPYDSPYDEDGSLREVLSHGAPFYNPLYNASLGSYDKSSTLNFLNTTTLQVWITPKVRFDGDFSFELSKANSDIFTSPRNTYFRNTEVSRKGSLVNAYTQSRTYQGKAMVSYNDYFFDKKLFLTAMGGSSIESNSSDSQRFTSVGFYSDKLAQAGYSSSYASGIPSSSDSKYNNVGFFVNANTIWDNRYFLDIIYRYEGSSKFGKNERFAPFYSFGAGWNIHNEKWMKALPFQLLKLRASLGYLGNISFEPYQARTMYYYSNTLNYVKGIGAIPMTIGNTNLKWERTESKNLGIDLTMFKSRFDFSFDVYVKNTDNLLLDVATAPSVGVSSSKQNVGEIENVGVEFTARVVPIQTKDWQWSISANYSYNKNKIKKISNSLQAQNRINAAAQTENVTTTVGDVTTTTTQTVVAPRPQYVEGQSLTALWVVPSAGIDPATGQEIFIKRDGTLTYVYDPNDKVIFGDTTPFGIGAINSYLTWKQFSLGATFRYSFGGAVYNETLATKVEGATREYNADERVFTSRWKAPGDVTKYRDIADLSAPKQSSRFVQTNNYLTLSTLSLAYEFEVGKIQKYGLRRLRLELLTNDLFYWSSVKRERGLNYPYDRSVELSLRFSL